MSRAPSAKRPGAARPPRTRGRAAGDAPVPVDVARAPGDAAMPGPAATARRLSAFRRRRSALLGADLFGEPVWDLLLQLYVARHEGRRPLITQLCEAALVPLTTGARWIGMLEARALVLRDADEEDGRRFHIRLSEPAAARLEELLAEAALTSD